MLPEFSLEGRVALITGAGRGLGRAMTLTMAEAGADVALLARRGHELSAVSAEVEALGRRTLPLPTDITDPAACDAAARQAIAQLGRVDVLVNNAGNLIIKPFVPLPGYRPAGGEQIAGFFEPTSNGEWQAVLDTHLTGAMHLCRALGPHMLERRSGKVINIASISGLRGERLHLSYDTAKGALIQMTRSLAVEWGRHGVQVNCIAPGHFRTEMTEEQYSNPEVYQRLVRGIPAGRAGNPREIGLLAAYLASPASDYMTGQTLFLDGGESV